MHESVSTTGTVKCRARSCPRLSSKTEQRRWKIYKGLVQVVEEDDMVTAENRCTSEKLQVARVFEDLYEYFQRGDGTEESHHDSMLTDAHDDRDEHESALLDYKSDRKASAKDLAEDLAYSSVKLGWQTGCLLLSPTASFATARSTLSEIESVELGVVQLEEWNGERGTILEKLTRCAARLDQRGFHPTLLIGIGLLAILQW